MLRAGLGLSADVGDVKAVAAATGTESEVPDEVGNAIGELNEELMGDSIIDMLIKFSSGEGDDVDGALVVKIKLGDGEEVEEIWVVVNAVEDV